MNNNNTIQKPTLTELTIYEGGALNEITIPDLLNNEIAIRQLVNNHNLKLQEVEASKQLIASLNSSLEYHRTAPFMSIVAIIVNIIGTIITSIGVTQNNILFIILGGILVVVGSLSTILYPYAKGWFNRTKTKNERVSQILN